MADYPPLEQLARGLLPALPLGVLLALLWLAVFRRRAEGFGNLILPLWQLLFLLALGVLTFGLATGTDPRPAAILLGIALAGLLLTAWIASGKSLGLPGVSLGRSRRSRGRRGKRRKTSASRIAISPGIFAPLLPVLILGGAVTALMIAVDFTPRTPLTARRPDDAPAARETTPVPTTDSPSPTITGVAGPQTEQQLPLAQETVPEVPPQEVMTADMEPAPTTGDSSLATLTADQEPGADAPAEVPPASIDSPPGRTQAVTFAPKTVSFRQQVVPILQRSCLDCHNADKQKGELRLDSPDFIRKGGKNGPIIVAGVPDRSPFYTMTTLDADDPDVMPSKGELLSPEAQQLLRTWIEEGADLEDGKPFGAVAAASQLPQSDIAPPATEATAIEPKILATLQRRFVVLRPLNNEHTLFEAVLRGESVEFPKPELALLEPIAANIHTLDLARTEITDADLAILASCGNLSVLRLAGTPIGDAAMHHLRNLASLRSLNLSATAVTDAGLAVLQGLASLEEVFAAGSKVTSDGAQRLEETTGARVYGAF